jgi:esterase
MTNELENRAWLEWYSHAALETLANAGRDAMYEIPVALATKLENWLKQTR